MPQVAGVSARCAADDADDFLAATTGLAAFQTCVEAVAAVGERPNSS